MRFLSRLSAGRELATALRPFAKSGSVIFALPRGGIVVAAEVARILRLPLDLILARKIGHPTNPEFAAGAIAEGGEPVYNNAEAAALDDEWRMEAEKNARHVITQRRKLYFSEDFIHPQVTDKQTIIVDDGMATGLTMLAAVTFLRKQQPKRIIVAIPAASRSSIDLLKNRADKCIVLDNPDSFGGAVGMYYDDFPQVDDATVTKLLERSKNYAIRQTTAVNPKT